MASGTVHGGRHCQKTLETNESGWQSNLSQKAILKHIPQGSDCLATGGIVSMRGFRVLFVAGTGVAAG
jgi:hypothetical protein